MLKDLPCFTAMAALACVGVFTLPVSAAWQTDRTLASPNGALTFLLEQDDTTGALAWSVTHARRPVVTRGALGLEITGLGVIADKGRVAKVEARSVATNWVPPYGERSIIPDQFHEETLTLQAAGQTGLSAQLQVRAYDEGIAFRYLVGGPGPFTVASEKTSFPLPPDATVWTSTSAQGKITRQAVSALKGSVERPLTAELAPDRFAALGEAALVN